MALQERMVDDSGKVQLLNEAMLTRLVIVEVSYWGVRECFENEMCDVNIQDSVCTDFNYFNRRYCKVFQDFYHPNFITFSFPTYIYFKACARIPQCTHYEAIAIRLRRPLRFLGA